MIRPTHLALVLALLTSALGGPSAFAQVSPRIPWETNLYSSWGRAVKEDRPLVAYFHMAGCKYCEQLDKEVLTGPAVGTLAGRAIFVRVDQGKDDEHKNVSRMMTSLEIDRFPVVVLLDARKDQIEEIARLVGYQPADKVVKSLSEGLVKWEKSRKDSKPAYLPEVTDVKKHFDANVLRVSEPAVIGSCSLANVAVAEALRKMGYVFKTEEIPGGKGCNHIVTVQQEGRATSVYVSHVFGRTIWLGIPLVRVETEKATGPNLLRVLEENWSLFPAQFNYDRGSRQLFLSKPLDQQEMLTPERFKAELDQLLALMKQKQGLWSSLGGR